MAIDKHAMYDAIARHTQAYPLKSDGTVWTTKERVAEIMLIKSETDAEIALLDEAQAQADLAAQPPVSPEHAEGISDLVSAWLIALRTGTDEQKAQFNVLQKQSYKAQYDAWVVAGRVGEVI